MDLNEKDFIGLVSSYYCLTEEQLMIRVHNLKMVIPDKFTTVEILGSLVEILKVDKCVGVKGLNRHCEIIEALSLAGVKAHDAGRSLSKVLKGF